MSKFYTYDAWFDTFEPIKNHLTNGEDYHFETYGSEVDYVWAQPNENVWTEVDGDSGTYIIAGKHFVNRFQYYITKKPWTDEMTEVPTSQYRDCDCLDENDYDPKPDCADCFGDGTISIDIDTVEALKQIYGEDTEIVG